MSAPVSFVVKTGERYAIRPVSPDDAEAVAELGSSVFGVEVGEKAGAAVRDLGGATGLLGAPRERPVHANYWLAVAEDGRIDGIVGLYSPRWIGPQSLYLGWFAVRPEKQGIGLGYALFEDARQRAIALGARAILVETAEEPEATVRFYRRVGFAEAARIPDYWEEGEPLLLMRCPVSGNTHRTSS